MTAVFRTARGGRVTRQLRNVAVPAFAIGAPTPLSQAEGNSGSAVFTFPVTRAVRLDVAASVDWAVAGTGANPTSPGDFNGPISGTLSFAGGETVKAISVSAKGDLAVEPDEAFLVTLTNPSMGTIAVATAGATILNDDSSGAPVTLVDLGGTFSLAEDAAAGAVAGALTGKSAGSTLSLVDDAGGRVALSGTDIVRGATGLDYETATSHSFTVREALGGATNTPHDTVLSLAVTDVAEGSPGKLDFSQPANSGLLAILEEEFA